MDSHVDDDLPTPPSRDELVDSLTRVAVREWVRQFVLLMQLAGEMYPEEIRTALGYVFDATAAINRLDQIAELANRADAESREAKQLAEEVGRDIEEKLGMANDWAEALEKRYAKAHAFLTRLAELHKTVKGGSRWG